MGIAALFFLATEPPSLLVELHHQHSQLKKEIENHLSPW